jgi:hypothetical protein
MRVAPRPPLQRNHSGKRRPVQLFDRAQQPRRRRRRRGDAAVRASGGGGEVRGQRLLAERLRTRGAADNRMPRAGASKPTHARRMRALSRFRFFLNTLAPRRIRPSSGAAPRRTVGEYSVRPFTSAASASTQPRCARRVSGRVTWLLVGATQGTDSSALAERATCAALRRDRLSSATTAASVAHSTSLCERYCCGGAAAASAASGGASSSAAAASGAAASGGAASGGAAAPHGAAAIRAQGAVSNAGGGRRRGSGCTSATRQRQMDGRAKTAHPCRRCAAARQRARCSRARAHAAVHHLLGSARVVPSSTPPTRKTRQQRAQARPSRSVARTQRMMRQFIASDRAGWVM